MSEYQEFENKMKKTCDALESQFATIRAGRANSAVLDQITVDYYGVPTPINQVASIATPDARSLLIQPWDGSILKGIEKAIMTSDLGIHPQNDGRMIRLVFPPLTEERRLDLVRQTKKYGEEAKVAIRNIRRDAIEKFKKMQKSSEITEDDYKNTEKDIQKLTDDFIKEIDKIMSKKSSGKSDGGTYFKCGGGRFERPPSYCYHTGRKRTLGEKACPPQNGRPCRRLRKLPQNCNLLQKYRRSVSHCLCLLNGKLVPSGR